MATLIRKEQVESAVEAIYPIGSVYISTSSTSPATSLGFGTWSAIAAGKTLVSLDSVDTDFDTAEETGGSKTHTLTSDELPEHYHTVDPPSTNTSGQSATHTHTYTRYTGTYSTSGGSTPNWKQGPNTGTSSAVSADHTHDFDIAEFNSGSNGSGSSHSNLQPYIVVYMWKRTA